MKQRQLFVVLTSILLGILFDVLFYNQTAGLNILLFSVTLISTSLYLANRFRKTIGTSTYLIAGGAILFALIAMIHTSPLLLFLNISLNIYLLILFAQLLLVSPRSLALFSPRNYIDPIISLPQSALNSLPKLMKDASTSTLQTNRKKLNVSNNSILRGTLFAIPILTIFTILFASADSVFKNLFSPILNFKFNISPDLVSHLVLIGIISSALAGTFAFLFLYANGKNHSDKLASNKSLVLNNTETYIILGSVVTLFLIFITVQMTYLFGGVQNIAGTGLSYAQYARKGFFELVAVAAISLVMIRIIDSRTLRRNLQEKVLFIWLSGMMILEVLIIMISALKRLALYEDAYGFTLSRLYGHVFIGWLAVAFAILFVHILRESKTRTFALHVFLSALFFAVFINVINPEAVIVRQNFAQYKQNISSKELDTYYLSHLSDDATPAIANELQNPNKQVVLKAESILAAQRERHSSKTLSWRSFNISHNNAHKIYVENKNSLNSYPYSDW